MNVFRTEKGRKLMYESYDKLLELWNVDLKQLDIETSYGKTHALIAGKKENPPQVLFHGAGDNSAMMWIRNMKGLAEKFYCIAVDTMGAAGKSKPDYRYGKGFDLSKWYCDIFDSFKIKKTFLAGVSYGCYHVQHCVITYPDRVIKAVGMVGYPKVKGYNFGIMKKAISLFFPIVFFPTDKNLNKIFKKFTGPDMDINDADEEIKRHFKLMIKYSSPASQRFHRRLTFLPEQVEQVKDKILFLVGDCDRLAYSPEVLRAFNDMDLNYRVFKNAGHLLNYEKAEEVNKVIIQFLFE